MVRLACGLFSATFPSLMWFFAKRQPFLRSKRPRLLKRLPIVMVSDFTVSLVRLGIGVLESLSVKPFAVNGWKSGAMTMLKPLQSWWMVLYWLVCMCLVPDTPRSCKVGFWNFLLVSTNMSPGSCLAIIMSFLKPTSFPKFWWMRVHPCWLCVMRTVSRCPRGTMGLDVLTMG